MRTLSGHWEILHPSPPFFFNVNSGTPQSFIWHQNWILNNPKSAGKHNFLSLRKVWVAFRLSLNRRSSLDIPSHHLEWVCSWGLMYDIPNNLLSFFVFFSYASALFRNNCVTLGFSPSNGQFRNLVHTLWKIFATACVPLLVFPIQRSHHKVPF